ncbi:predicted protein [Lichtheimia corymbifera JMRC:FSU:9682]|uniref:Uncharacterized protein n=1 Tax=Lichtheimia corymbifera JMRC:FSU:9682 TaxID=1263082 RepID=A0A068S9I6_9FUNG|nr:predicted protein [Lichtheimia corymbifera JMRC:FSU:9682]
MGPGRTNQRSAGELFVGAGYIGIKYLDYDVAITTHGLVLKEEDGTLCNPPKVIYDCNMMGTMDSPFRSTLNLTLFRIRLLVEEDAHAVFLWNRRKIMQQGFQDVVHRRNTVHSYHTTVDLYLIQG